MPQFIDDNGESPMAYNSILVSPEKLSIFGSELCLKVVKELAKKPCCAMDLARKLEQHEQKIYYHLRNLEGAGIINQIRTEQRYGMTAKIYAVVSPVVATRLYNDGYPLEDDIPVRNPAVLKFLHPFVKDGKLNAKIIVGNPRPHGKYDEAARDGAYVSDLALFLGNFIKKLELPCYKIDTQVREGDLKDNLILIGNPKFNIIVDKLNSALPLYFDKEKEWSIVSKLTNKTYNDLAVGLVIKCDNPFNKKKKILLLAGKRSRGTRAAIIALTQHTEKIMGGNTIDNKEIAKVVMGLDRDSDYEIDDVKFLE